MDLISNRKNSGRVTHSEARVWDLHFKVPLQDAKTMNFKKQTHKLIERLRT